MVVLLVEALQIVGVVLAEKLMLVVFLTHGVRSVLGFRESNAHSL